MIHAIRLLETQAAAKPKTKAPVFADCADKYIEAHRAGWKNAKHAEQWPSTVRMLVKWRQ